MLTKKYIYIYINVYIYIYTLKIIGGSHTADNSQPIVVGSDFFKMQGYYYVRDLTDIGCHRQTNTKQHTTTQHKINK